MMYTLGHAYNTEHADANTVFRVLVSCLFVHSSLEIYELALTCTMIVRTALFLGLMKSSYREWLGSSYHTGGQFEFAAYWDM